MTILKKAFHPGQFSTLPDQPETLINETAACKELGVTPEILRAFCALYDIKSTGEINGIGNFYRYSQIEEIMSGNHMKNFIYQVGNDN